MARRVFTFQLYYSKRLRYLHANIDLAAEIHNHLIAVQIMLRHSPRLRRRRGASLTASLPHQRDWNAATNIYQEGLRPALAQSHQGASSCERGGCKTRQRAATV